MTDELNDRDAPDPEKDPLAWLGDCLAECGPDPRAVERERLQTLRFITEIQSDFSPPKHVCEILSWPEED